VLRSTVTVCNGAEVGPAAEAKKRVTNNAHNIGRVFSSLDACG